MREALGLCSKDMDDDLDKRTEDQKHLKCNDLLSNMLSELLLS